MILCFMILFTSGIPREDSQNHGEPERPERSPSTSVENRVRRNFGPCLAQLSSGVPLDSTAARSRNSPELEEQRCIRV